MAKIKKFGAFSGVFTPSILTILGVIMYLRLGWVIGQGGLILSLLIILVAHIISVTTGLSISSIATDKKIKTGGIYYILSRSLGMAMGGSIGIALFIGTALSISLYIVGFTENFLSIPAISNFLHMHGSINDIRIVGTLVIISLVILAFISTAVVIKTQYFILGAIFLSLLSIGIGLYTSGNPSGNEILWKPAAEHLPFEYLFAVFFPAVTGFTAGVAMSGDLKNPNKDIPRGTLAAILVGFLVYAGLAIGVAAFVDRDLLLNDNNYLMQIAWFSPFVIAGIWGATLSSALGGILGGPRILQAIAQDKILPSFLGKGYGINNEPRNALLVIFVLAELGILVGDLNIIAGVVSMFYLASYGFINLAFALESFAGADFRPTFRISKWVGVIGFIASFAVMFKLDATAMTFAFLIMTGIYVILKRKEMRSDFGDVWTSVWNSVARSALYKMDRNKIEDRNWQPNIILFSGSSSKRQYLVEFGKSLVGKFGVLSNFDLIENPSAEYLFPKHEQSVSNPQKEVGIFYRRQTCKDIYQGIEMIASTYGFSGMEPNTVLMGWAKQSSQPEKFVHLIKSLNQLDLNVLLMDYDKNRGFGNRAVIDIWWRGEGQNNNLALFLAKFLMASPQWENAKLRLISISQFEQQGEMLYKKARYVLEALRIEAEVHIINNQYNKQNVYDIIKEESLHSDLVFMGLPDIHPGKEDAFVRQTNRLLGLIGTVVLVKASSRFRKMIFIPEELVNIPKLKPERITEPPKNKFNDIAAKHHLKKEISEELQKLYFELKNLASFVSVNYVKPITSKYTEILTEHLQELNRIIDKITDKEYNSSEIIHQLNQIEQTSAKIINELYLLANSGKEIQDRAITQYQNGINKILENKKQKIKLYYSREEIKNLPANIPSLKRIKKQLEWKSRLGNKVKYTFSYKKVLENQLPFHSNINFYIYQANLFSIFFDTLSGIKELFRKTQFLLPPINETGETDKIILHQNRLDELQQNMHNLKKQKSILSEYPDNFMHLIYAKPVDELAALYEKPNVNLLSKLSAKQKLEMETAKERVFLLSEFWHSGFQYFLNELSLDNILATGSIKLYELVNQLNKEIFQVLDFSFKDAIRLLDENIKSVIELSTKRRKKNIEIQEIKIPDTETISLLLNEIKEQFINDLKQLPENVPEHTLITDNFSIAGLFTIEQNIKKQKIPAKHLFEEIITNDLIAVIYRIFDLLENKSFEFYNKIQNYDHLLQLSLDKMLSDNQDDELPEEENFLENKQKSVNLLKIELKDLKDELKEKLLNAYVRVENKFQLFNFKKEAENRTQTNGTAKNIRFNLLHKYIAQSKELINKQVEIFWHRRSEALLFSRFLKAKEEKKETSAGELARFIHRLSFNRTMHEQLPFYYRYLFLNKEFFNTDFWFHHEQEILQAKKAISGFHSGIGGAIIITGKANSGKSFFIHKIINDLAGKSRIYKIQAKRERKISKKTLNTAFQKSTQINGDNHKILNELPQKSFIVIENIELWWQRSENGNLIIDQLTDLIGNFGDKHLFILSLDADALNIIRQTSDLEMVTADEIRMSEFSAKQLQDAIMFRHNSSAVKFKIENQEKTQDELKDKELARIFYRYFVLSEGNIGTALYYWMTNITDFDGNYLKVKILELPDHSPLNYLNTDSLLIISQFTTHKYLSFNHLQEILMLDKHILSKEFDFLVKVNVLQKSSANRYQINPAIYLPLRKLLTEKGFVAYKPS